MATSPIPSFIRGPHIPGPIAPGQPLGALHPDEALLFGAPPASQQEAVDRMLRAILAPPHSTEEGKDAGFGMMVSSPKNAEELAQRKNFFSQFFTKVANEPGLQNALLQLAAVILQPIDPNKGESVGSKLGQGLSAFGTTYSEGRAQDKRLALAEKEDVRREEELKMARQQASDTAQKAAYERSVQPSPESVAEERSVDLNAKKALYQSRLLDIKIARLGLSGSLTPAQQQELNDLKMQKARLEVQVAENQAKALPSPELQQASTESNLRSNIEDYLSKLSPEDRLAAAKDEAKLAKLRVDIAELELGSALEPSQSKRLNELKVQEAELAAKVNQRMAASMPNSSLAKGAAEAQARGTIREEASQLPANEALADRRGQAVLTQQQIAANRIKLEQATEQALNDPNRLVNLVARSHVGPDGSDEDFLKERQKILAGLETISDADMIKMLAEIAAGASITGDLNTIIASMSEQNFARLKTAITNAMSGKVPEQTSTGTDEKQSTLSRRIRVPSAANPADINKARGQ